MFNLRQLMLLEEERSSEEQRIAREQHAAKVQARLHRLRLRRAAEAQRARESAEAAERARIERDVALRRVELEVAAVQSERTAQVKQEHARAFARLEAEDRLRSVRQRRRGALLVAFCSVLMGVALSWAVRRSAEADASLQQARASAAQQAHELDKLRARVSELASAGHQTEPPSQQPSAAAQPPSAATASARPRAKLRRRPVRTEHPRRQTEETNDLGLDNGSLDPIEGL